MDGAPERAARVGGWDSCVTARRRNIRNLQPKAEDMAQIEDHEERVRVLEFLTPCICPLSFRARRKTTFQTLGSGGAETDLEWNYWENNGPGIFTPLDAGETEVTDPTDPVRFVRLEQAGYYMISGCISVQSLASGHIVIVINDGYDNPEIIVHPAQVAGSGGDYVFCQGKSYPIFDPFDSPGGVAEISIDAAQNSGVNRNTRFGTYLEITYQPLGS